MHQLPIFRWGEPYASLETAEVVHFATGEPVGQIGLANGGLIQRDMRKATQARDALRSMTPDQLLDTCARAADLFQSATLTIGDIEQSPQDFVRLQSASTGMPENMCRANMQKIAFVLSRQREILDALTRGLDLAIFQRGFGKEDRDVILSYQAQSPVLGAVLPSNSPGVHTLWIPAISLQIGLVLKPGSSEPWTPYRIAAALWKAGIPRNAIGLYPGGHDAGPALIQSCRRTLVFGSQQTVEQYRGNPSVSVHGPGFSKILIGDDVVDDWESHLDVLVESVLSNGGRSCINCSSIWASRHTQEIACALAERMGPIDALPPNDTSAQLAAFTDPKIGHAVWRLVEEDLRDSNVTHVTESLGNRVVEHPRCIYLRPTVLHCDSPEAPVAKKEYMFPFVSVVRCEQSQMLNQMGPTLVATALTTNVDWIAALTDSIEIDRLNIGPIPTNRLNWLQPHEGNIVEFLYRARAYQVADGIPTPGEPARSGDPR